jgi:hypothetical protein
MGNSMPKCLMSCVPAIFAGLSAIAIMLGTDRAALAADDCLAAPSGPSVPGGHWYFRSDKANNRKCWYLVEPGTRPPTAETPEMQPVEATPQPTFGSFFSLMGLPGATPQPDTTNSVGRTTQGTRPDDVRSGERARPARRPDSQAALTPKPHRPAPTAAAPAERPASPDQGERDAALFQEFLRWRERKTQ